MALKAIVEGSGTTAGSKVRDNTPSNPLAKVIGVGDRVPVLMNS
jgi:hypothetical protein